MDCHSQGWGRQRLVLEVKCSLSVVWVCMYTFLRVIRRVIYTTRLCNIHRRQEKTVMPRRCKIIHIIREMIKHWHDKFIVKTCLNKTIPQCPSVHSLFFLFDRRAWIFPYFLSNAITTYDHRWFTSLSSLKHFGDSHLSVQTLNTKQS